MARMLSMQEASQRLGVSFWTVHRLVKHGKLITSKVGRRRFVHESDLDSFMNQCRQVPPRRRRTRGLGR